MKPGSQKITIAFEHESPEYTLIIFGNLSKRSEAYLDEMFIRDTYEYNPGDLLTIHHDDETLRVINTRCKTLEEVKAKVMKSIEKSLKKTLTPEKDYAFVDFAPLFTEEDIEWEDREITPENLWNWICDVYQDSYIDCDSSMCYGLFDTEKKEFILGGNDFDINVMTAEEFDKRLDDEE